MNIGRRCSLKADLFFTSSLFTDINEMLLRLYYVVGGASDGASVILKSASSILVDMLPVSDCMSFSVKAAT